MLEYTTRDIEEIVYNIHNKVLNNSSFAEMEIRRVRERHKDKVNYLRLYQSLVGIYGYCAECYLLANNDTEKFKGYCFLAANAGSILFKLYDKGLRANDVFAQSLGSRKNAYYYIQYAILANHPETALPITREDSVWRCILNREYDETVKYLPEEIKQEKFTSYVNEILWAIVYRNEKKMNQYFEKRVKMLRRQAKAATPTEFDSHGLALIILAKERGMTCNLNVRELPQHLLDDIPVNEEEWQLPKDPEVDKILADVE